MVLHCHLAQLVILICNQPRADDPSLSLRGGRFACQYCSARFDKSEHIKRHLRSHTQEKPFVCARCGRDFSRQDSLKRHLKTHDGNPSNDQAHTSSPPESLRSTDYSPDGLSPSTRSLRQSDPETHMSAASGNGVSMPAYSSTIPGPANASVAAPGLLRSLHSSTSAQAGPPALSAADWAVARPGMIVSHVPSRPSTDATTLDPRVMEAWLNPEALEMGRQSASLGDAFDPDASAYFDSLFGNSTADVFCQSRSQSVINKQPSDPLLPLEPTRAQQVCEGWKLRFISTSPFQPQDGFPLPEYKQQTAASLARELRMPETDEIALDSMIPSLNFVDLAVSQYFARWHPQLPILHRPTFSRTTASPLLLISVISIGAVYLNTPDARARAFTLFKRLQEFICATWLKHIQHSAAACLTVAQLAVIGQSFALSNGDIPCLLIFQTYHHAIVSWARWAGITETGPERDALIKEVMLKEGNDLEKAWHAWIDREKARRVVQGLVIHENELSARSCSPATAWHTHLPSPSSEQLFEAPDAVSWRNTLVAESAMSPAGLSQSSFFQLSVALAELQIESSALNALPDLGLKPAAMVQFAQRIEQLRQNATSLASTTTVTSRGLGSSALALLHTTALSLHTDLNLIERCCGRDGPTPAQSISQLVLWAAGEDGRRAAVHAARALHHAGCLGGPLHESGLHAVRCTFQAALTLFAFIAIAPLADHKSSPPIDLYTCDTEHFVKEGRGQRVMVHGFLDSGGDSRRLDAMALLLASAQTCARTTTFGIGNATSDILTTVYSKGL